VQLIRAHSLFAVFAFLAACGDDRPPPVTFPPGDPDGGSVTGTITTDLTSTSGGYMYVGAFAPDAGALVAGIVLGEAPFPVHYQMDRVPAGYQVIRATLDFPPYSPRPLTAPAGLEDEIGVYLNPSSVEPVNIRPGAVTSRIDFYLQHR
jgi:hypothetical protein